MLTAAQKLVQYALSIGALELTPEGRILKSRRKSPYFFNSGLFCTGGTIKRLAGAYAYAISNLPKKPDVIFGPAYKGTILAPAIAIQLDKMGIKVSFATNRKEVKDHGEGGSLIGSSLKEASVVIVDDVITTGDTKAQAIKFVKHHGGSVLGVIVAFDRQETAGRSDKSALQIFQKKTGIPVHAITNLDDLIAVLEDDTDFLSHEIKTLTQIKKYKKRFGVK